MDMISAEKVEELKRLINEWSKDTANRINQDYDKLCSALKEKATRMFCEELQEGRIRNFNEGTIRDLISNQLGMMKYNILSKKMQPNMEDGQMILGNTIRDYCLLDENVEKDELDYTKRKAEDNKDYHKDSANKAFDFEWQYNEGIDGILADVKGHILRQNDNDPLAYDKFADIKSRMERTLKGSIYQMLQQTLNDNTKKMYLSSYDKIATEVINELDTYVKDKTKENEKTNKSENKPKNEQPKSDLEDMFY
ncbi:MAG: hypothetical protein E7311_06150 [Clostridiales bacterium]|nr:hypothetical protein [Clostridiales bacterium]